jgi:hypothetical protein
MSVGICQNPFDCRTASALKTVEAHRQATAIGLKIATAAFALEEMACAFSRK